MRTLAHQPALIHDENAVRMPDGRDPLGNDQNGL